MGRAELELVESEDEMMSGEASGLLAELNSEIAYGESLGVFTPKEANDWYAGAAACTKIAHLEGLLGYIDRFVASGQARLNKLGQTVDNDLLTSGEQISYLNEADSISYEAKGQLISKISGLIKELQSLKSDLISMLNKKKVEANDKAALISKFYSSSATSKGSVVSEAEKIRETEELVEIKTNKPTITDRPSIQPEIVEPPAIFKDPKADCLDLVEQYFKHNQFSQAIDLVEASSRYFNLAEYRALLKRIEKARLAKEIPDLQTLLRAA
jgi:hypothetical protein